LKLLTPEQTLDEATNCWPGIGVAPDGYVPVASCLIGTGDYYYINVNDGPGGPLYRIYHEAVGEHGYKANEAVAVVLSNYERLLEYVEP
jgi:5-deoxy-D-glucuronate isomerase